VDAEREEPEEERDEEPEQDGGGDNEPRGARGVWSVRATCGRVRQLLCGSAHAAAFYAASFASGLGSSLVEGLLFLFFTQELKASNALCANAAPVPLETYRN
jgi:hypothetical protein